MRDATETNEPLAHRSATSAQAASSRAVEVWLPVELGTSALIRAIAPGLSSEPARKRSYVARRALARRAAACFAAERRALVRCAAARRVLARFALALPVDPAGAAVSVAADAAGVRDPPAGADVVGAEKVDRG